MNRREKLKTEMLKAEISAFQLFSFSACCFLVLSTPLSAQDASKPPLPSNAPAFIAPPAPLPTLSSPVEVFRRLLAMTPAEQKQFVAGREPEQQRRILAKLREYESLRPNQRELRLRATELQWYLTPLLSVPSANRPLQSAPLTGASPSASASASQRTE